jgi:hypothetical protein
MSRAKSVSNSIHLRLATLHAIYSFSFLNSVTICCQNVYLRYHLTTSFFTNILQSFYKIMRVLVDFDPYVFNIYDNRYLIFQYNNWYFFGNNVKFVFTLIRVFIITSRIMFRTIDIFSHILAKKTCCWERIDKEAIAHPYPTWD